MYLTSPKGAKVRFLNKHGHKWQPGAARKIGLKKGHIYTVDDLAVGGFTSAVMLQEFPGEWFNTVMFENVAEEA